MSNTKSIAREQIVGEEGIVTLAGGAIEMDSLTTPGKRYKVHVDSGYCSCPANYYHGDCKHLVIAEALEIARALPVGAFLAERKVMEMAHKVFAPAKSGSCMDSYNDLLDVLSSRHSTNGLVQAAIKRHARVLALHEKAA